MSQPDQTTMLGLITENIQRSGFHIYTVVQSEVPRFSYTIGLWEALGPELVLAGGIYYMADEVGTILQAIREELTTSRDFDCVMTIDTLGSFTLREVHDSWIPLMLLGAVDYYASNKIRAYQIVPDQHHWTIDTPNMTSEWSATGEPIWRWLCDGWSFAVPRDSNVATNLQALRGAPITEVARWGEGEWEMFAGPGPEVTDEDCRVVPLGCVLGADPSLAPALDLEVGKGLWRDEDGGDWHPWGRTKDDDR